MTFPTEGVSYIHGQYCIHYNNMRSTRQYAFSVYVYTVNCISPSVSALLFVKKKKKKKKSNSTICVCMCACVCACICVCIPHVRMKQLPDKALIITEEQRVT